MFSISFRLNHITNSIAPKTAVTMEVTVARHVRRKGQIVVPIGFEPSPHITDWFQL